MNENITPPMLIEPGVRYFIGSTLKACRKFKDNHISGIFNMALIAMFMVFLGGILLYRYKGQPTRAELEIKNRKKQEYILSKLSQIAVQKNSQSIITGLPLWNGQQ